MVSVYEIISLSISGLGIIITGVFSFFLWKATKKSTEVSKLVWEYTKKREEDLSREKRLDFIDKMKTLHYFIPGWFNTNNIAFNDVVNIFASFDRTSLSGVFDKEEINKIIEVKLFAEYCIHEYRENIKGFDTTLPQQLMTKVNKLIDDLEK